MEQQELCYVTGRSGNGKSYHRQWPKIILKSMQSEHFYAPTLQDHSFHWLSVVFRDRENTERGEDCHPVLGGGICHFHTHVRAPSDWHLSSLLTHLPTTNL